MEVWYQLKEYDFKDIKDFSKKQLYRHAQIYQDNVKKLNALSLLKDFEGSKNISPAERLKLEKSNEMELLNAVRLHELYFNNLGCEYSKCSWDILRAIENYFGAYQQWLQNITDLGMAAKAWVILTFDTFEQSLRIYAVDENSSAAWGTQPLLAMDVCEHAYVIDFGTDREAYINKFIDNINWYEVNKNLRGYLGNQWLCFTHFL